MKRMLLIAWLTLSPCIWVAAAGCEKEVRTVDHKQTVQESEPKMVSPGQEVLE
jgi:hypothetical protein